VLNASCEFLGLGSIALPFSLVLSFLFTCFPGNFFQYVKERLSFTLANKKNSDHSGSILILLAYPPSLTP